LPRFVTLGTRFFSVETVLSITLLGTRDYHIILIKKGLCLSKRQTWSVTARLHFATQTFGRPAGFGKSVMAEK
jgi:hypothetical protein